MGWPGSALFVLGRTWTLKFGLINKWDRLGLSGRKPGPNRIHFASVEYGFVGGKKKAMQNIKKKLMKKLGLARLIN